ncbi:Titin [Vanrija pseudolonga]|uniref:Titin n=1 Tax=Vanrija pseudolonga TaxID=143232 RepID=A0AAF0YAG2_9TREE|nr:Titin [Vanrija pseudolonga]
MEVHTHPPADPRAARALPTVPGTDGQRRVSVGNVDGAARRFGPRALPSPPGKSPPPTFQSPPSIAQASPPPATLSSPLPATLSSPPPAAVSPVALPPGPAAFTTPPPGQYAPSPYAPPQHVVQPSPPAPAPTHDPSYAPGARRSDLKERIASAIGNVQQASSTLPGSPPPTTYYPSLSPPQSPPAHGVDGLAFSGLSIGGPTDGLAPPNAPFAHQRVPSPLPDVQTMYHSNIPHPPPAIWNVSTAPLVAPQATAPPSRFDDVLTPPPAQPSEPAPPVQTYAPTQTQPGAYSSHHQAVDVYGAAAAARSYFPQATQPGVPQQQQQQQQYSAMVASHLPTPPDSAGMPPQQGAAPVNLPTSPAAYPAAPPPTSVSEVPPQASVFAYQATPVAQQPAGAVQQPGATAPVAAAPAGYAPATAIPGQPSFLAPPAAPAPAGAAPAAPGVASGHYNANLPHNRSLPVIPRVDPQLAILPHCIVNDSMTLALKDNIFFKVADPTARDVNGNVVFKFSNKKAASKVMIMHDINDNVLYMFDQATSRGLNKAVIRSGQGQDLIRIDTMYSAMSKFRISFTNTVTGQPASLSVQGKLWVGLQCQLVLDNGQVVAHIIRDKTKALLLSAEKATYTLTVAPGVDLALITIVVAALNQIDESRAMNFVNVAAQHLPIGD